MPRKTRMFVPDVPSHVVSRGNNRNACFYTDGDYFFYLQCLSEACHKHRVSVHAYVLMTNHVHLLLTPESEDGIPCVMQSIGRRYVQYINKTYNRSGTLWEGRYKASLVDAENYLLACYRYIELNPVRASIVRHPADYRWSSYGVNAGIKPGKQLVAHEVFQRLGSDEKSRYQAYRALFSVDLEKSLLQDIQRATTFSMPLGGRDFQVQIEKAIGRKLGHARRGRPMKIKCE